VQSVTTAEGALLTAPKTRWWPGWLLPPATILVIVVAGVLLLMTPLWMHFALGAAGGTLRAPMTGDFALYVSDRTVAELLFGPGTFQITADRNFGPAIWEADEAAHLRDARLVLYVFLALAALSLVVLAVAAWRSRRDVRFWRALRRGGSVLVIGTAVLGVIGFFAFDAGFELFHRIFFPGGNWSFSPDSLLIRLYPYAFWQLTAGALGVLCVVAGSLVWIYARRRMLRLEALP
jgi:uncharacterized protein DUF1461